MYIIKYEVSVGSRCFSGPGAAKLAGKERMGKMALSPSARKNALFWLVPLFMAFFSFADLAGAVSNREKGSPWSIAPERDIVFRPEEAVRLMEIKNGDVVIDFGSGLGYFTFRLARAAGPSGKVYAVDVVYRKPETKATILDRVNDRVLNPYDNVEVVANLYYNVPLPRESADVAFMCLDSAFLVDEKGLKLPVQRERFDLNRRSLTSLCEALKPGGRLIVVDVCMMGDDNDYEHPFDDGAFMNFLVARDLNVVKKNFESLGLRFVKERDIYMSEEFLKDVSEFKKTDLFGEMKNESKFFMCNRKFFFIFEKPAAK